MILLRIFRPKLKQSMQIDYLFKNRLLLIEYLMNTDIHVSTIERKKEDCVDDAGKKESDADERVHDAEVMDFGWTTYRKEANDINMRLLNKITIQIFGMILR